MKNIKQHVTIVPASNLILVDGKGLQVSFDSPTSLHALQWHDGKGQCEWIDGVNTFFTMEDYATQVAPYVDIWEAEQISMLTVKAKEEAKMMAEYNSVTARAKRFRLARDKRLADCDYLMVSDYPLSESQRELWKIYRQALRDMTLLSGFPWSGGGKDDTECPWPVQQISNQ